jgi:hypothetical protein
MHQVGKLGLAAVLATFAALGCKSGSDTFRTPGPDNDEQLQRTQQDYSADEPAKKSTTWSTPGESLGEAKGKGLVEDGQGGGPIDTERPSEKMTPPSTEKSDKDGTLETPGATEKEVTDEDVKSSPLK